MPVCQQDLYMSVGSSQVQKHQLYAALQSHTEEEQTEKERHHPEADLEIFLLFFFF